MTHHHLRAGDQALFVQELGEGPPVLFLSGLGYASWCWEDAMALLAPDHRVLALDNRGTGRSAKPRGPYSIEMYADDAAAALTDLGIDSAHIVGNSMGGYIALMLAVRHPARVRSLLLSNTTQGGEGTVPLPVETAAAWTAAAVLPPREFATATMGLSYPPGWAEAHPARFAELLERRLEFPTPQECWYAQRDASMAFAATGLDVSGIAQRAVVIHGTEDRIIPYANGPRLARALPQGELITLERTGHLPFLQDPPAFADLARRAFR